MLTSLTMRCCVFWFSQPIIAGLNSPKEYISQHAMWITSMGQGPVPPYRLHHLVCRGNSWAVAWEGQHETEWECRWLRQGSCSSSSGAVWVRIEVHWRGCMSCDSSEILLVATTPGSSTSTEKCEDREKLLSATRLQSLKCRFQEAVWRCGDEFTPFPLRAQLFHDRGFYEAY